MLAEEATAVAQNMANRKTARVNKTRGMSLYSIGRVNVEMKGQSFLLISQTLVSTIGK